MSDLSLAYNTSHSGRTEILTGRLSHTAVLWVISLSALRDFLQPFFSLYCTETHSGAPLTKGFWLSWSVASTGGRWCVWEKADTRAFLCALLKGRLPLSLQPTVGPSSCCCSSEFLTLSSSVSRLYKHNPYFRFSLFEIPGDVSRFLADKYVLCLVTFINSHQLFPKRNSLLPIQLWRPFSVGTSFHLCIYHTAL